MRQDYDDYYDPFDSPRERVQRVYVEPNTIIEYVDSNPYKTKELERQRDALITEIENLRAEIFRLKGEDDPTKMEIPKRENE